EFRMIIGSPPLHQSPLASPTSPYDHTVSTLGRRASTASIRSEGTVVDDNDAYAFVRPYAKRFCSLMVQALVQSRQNEKYDTVGDVSTNSRAWFNLEQDEIGEITVHMKKNVTNYPPLISSFSVDFILYTADGDTLPLETWCLSYEPTSNPFQSSTSGRVSPSTVAEAKSKFYGQLGILLRSVIVAARMTPMHRYYVKKQSAETYVITYRVLEGRSTIDLGEESKKKDLGSVNAPYGTFYLHLAYRTKMEIDRAASPASNDSFQGVHISPGTSPLVAGTPSSFCDVLSQFSASPSSQMANSPPYSRSRAVSEATSEPGIHILREKRTSGSSGKSLEEAFSSSKEDENTMVEKKEGAESDEEEEMNQSKLESAEMKKIPFANLLISSYTGILMTHGLSPTEKERVEAACTASMRIEKSESLYRSRCDSAVIPEEESRSDGSEENSGESEGSGGSSEEERTVKGEEVPSSTESSSEDVEYSGLSDELTNSLLHTSTATATELSMTATLTVAAKGEKGEREDEDESVMTSTLRDDAILRRSLLDVGEAGEEKGGGKSVEECASEKSEGGGSEDEEEDSFVRIAPLFSTHSFSTPGEDLSEMITQLKASPEIEGNAGYGIDLLQEISQNELSMFSSLQGDFDRLVAHVKEAVEEDERREREGVYSASVIQKMTPA
ncbi:hypothetical protein PMAYCL1PPCAC_30027, partial [Pristionchus mayeri]